jgi:hypothetical protein
MADDTRSAQEFLDAPSVLDQPDPMEQMEKKRGAMDFLRSLRPDIFDEVFGRTDISDDEKLDITRATIREQAESDPDSLLTMFGIESKLKKLFDGLAPKAPAQVDNPANALQGSAHLSGPNPSIDEQ